MTILRDFKVPRLDRDFRPSRPGGDRDSEKWCLETVSKPKHVLRHYSFGEYNEGRMVSDDISESSVTSPALTTFTNLFDESSQVTQSISEFNNGVFCSCDLGMRVEIEDRQRELPRNAALYFERKRMTKKIKEQTSLAETAKARTTCKNLGSRTAFPKTDSLSSNEDIEMIPWLKVNLI